MHNKHAVLNRSALTELEANVAGGMGTLCGPSGKVDPLRVMEDYGGRDDPLTTRDYGPISRLGGGGDPLTQPTSTYYQAGALVN